ncbi:DUF58 domain-containing protein [Novosphingobium taihuense]|uniref:Uncharacterized protein (DUF58 family) n=1 Tax=Novosphingobium taihuense TaxID=260085 RepID=A0A7W7AF55_9SPHN|nr:DUF58 domain-containing protein [Novosphingobium taihuense]MBB4615878.1 uncharacterized protein (DUF58 family) [Novosphingobium taihuense]TWH78553.1 uncharacterized protein (DUF58 family) [Novosphingobium taihuense]
MSRPAALLPSGRAVLIIAGLAPLALVLAAAAPGAWIAAPAIGGALLVLVLLDGLFAGSLADLRVIAPADTEVGEPSQITILADLARIGARARPEAALECDPRLAPGGRIALPLTFSDGAWSGTADIAPTRRGTGALSRVWLRWNGPLGLAHRQITRALEAEVRVWPNIAPVRSPALQIFLRDAQFGLIARRIRGEGTDFEALAEYEPGMDRRRIDWKSSARHARLFAKEYEVERNNQIVFAFDCGQSMCEPIEGLPRIDRAVTAALTTAYVALKAQDRVALFGFAARPEVATPFVTDSRDFARLQRAAAQLDYHPGEPNFTLALSTLAARLQRRSLIVLFSDFTDPTSAELMVENVGRLVEKHLVLFVVMTDAELAALATAPVTDMQSVAEAVTATGLARQRALVLQRLRHLGVRVLEARHDQIGTRLLDAYLAIKREGRIG